jgi:hypothetical protein
MRIPAARSTLALAGVVMLLVSQRHMAFMLFFVFLPLFPWLIYSGFVIARNPTRRAMQTQKVAIWLTAVLLVVGVHIYWHVATRHQAQDLANAIQKYVLQNGVCPPSLEAIGITKVQLKAKLGYASYVCEAGHPRLFYGSTFAPFETDHYDFEKDVWRHVGD